MLKKLLLLVLGLSFGISPLAQAQTDDRLVIDLSATFTVADLGFTFAYPQDWVFDTSDGIRLAENQADLEAFLADDPTTGYTLRLAAFPIAALGVADPTLDNLVTTLVDAAGIEIDQQAEFPVMSRRAITFNGIDENGEIGILSTWLQDDFLVVFSFGIPEAVGFTDDVFYTWGFMLAQIQMITPVNETLILEFPFLDGTLINYPSDWIADFGDYGMVIVSTKNDYQVFLDDAPPSQLEETLLYFIPQELSADQAQLTVETAYNNLLNTGTIANPSRISEHLIFDQPALSFWADEPNSGLPMVGVIGVLENNFYLFYVQSPSEKAREAYFPILLNMLNSVRSAN